MVYQSLIDLELLRNDDNQYLLIGKLDELFQRIKGYYPRKPGVISKVCYFYILVKYEQEGQK